MRFTSIVCACLAASLSVASPIEVEKRVTAPKVDDSIIVCAQLVFLIIQPSPNEVNSSTTL